MLFIAKCIHCQCTIYISIYFQVTDLEKYHETFKKLKNAQNSLWEADCFQKNDNCECGYLPGWSSSVFRYNPVLPNRLRALKLCAIYPQSCMEVLTILGTTALMASSFRHTGQIQSLHHQNLAPWPKTAFEIAQILFAAFYLIFWG